MSKIGIQSQSGTIPDFRKVIDKKPVAWLLLGNAVGLQLAKDIKAASPNTLVLIRTPTGDWAYRDPGFNANYLERALSGADPFQKAGVIDFLMPPNEPVIATDADAKQLNDAQVTYATELKKRGYRTGAYTFPVGNPDFRFWALLQDGIRACDGWLFLHEYDIPNHPQIPFWSLRHRKVRPLIAHDIELKIGITECLIDLGVDKSVFGRAGGFRAMPDNGHLMDDYIAHLNWWDGELANDDYVKFACVFGYSMEQPWVGLGFDVASDNEDRVKFISWLSSAAVILPPPHQPPPAFAFTSYPLPACFPIIQGFGENPSIYKPLGLPGHEGIDIGCQSGTPVSAMADGTVSDVNSDSNFGQYVVVNHPDDWQTIYEHLSRIDVGKGQPVKSGNKLGLSGASGNAASPHLHITLKHLNHDFTDVNGTLWPQNIFDPTALLLAVTPSQGGHMSTAQERINAAWLSTGIPFNPTAAFPMKAKALGLGRPVAKEYRYTAGNGQKMAGQGFEKAFLECVEGDFAPEHITAYDWLSGAVYVPAATPATPAGGVPMSFAVPPALSSIGASATEGTPVAGQPFYRLSGASIRSGVSAFCRVTVIGMNGVPAVGTQVVNLFPDGNGEILVTDGSGAVTFNYGPASAFTPPAVGPFTVFIASGAVKTDGPPKRVSFAAKLSDTIISLGDPNGTHTECNVQFVQQ